MAVTANEPGSACNTGTLLDAVVQSALAFSEMRQSMAKFYQMTNGLPDPQAKKVLVNLQLRLDKAIMEYAEAIKVKPENKGNGHETNHSEGQRP